MRTAGMTTNHAHRAAWGRTRAAIAILVIGAATVGLGAPGMGASPPEIITVNASETKGFRKAVTLQGIREHQAALQSIADANNSTRVSGTAGHDASAQYVYDRAAAAGYDVSVQEVTFEFAGDRTPPVLERVAPEKTYVNAQDFSTMTYSGNGDVTRTVTAVDLILPIPAGSSSTSGCEATDFAGFPVGDIALMQRGTCPFRDKALNAQAAGASGAIIFNEGSDASRSGLINGTLSPPQLPFPVIGTSFAVGVEISNLISNGPTGISVHLRTDFVVEARSTRNVIAETPGGDPGNVVVVGAHLDAEGQGPGINNNGSGSAAILEIAEVFAAQERDARNKLRFIWFGANNPGLAGSSYYVAQLTPADAASIRVMLNFDALGSPNFVRFLNDGDNSTFPAPPSQRGPEGSGAIETLFRDYFALQGLAHEPTPLAPGSSDFSPFIDAGIPVGGLFAGGDGLKTPAQAQVYGGTANQPYDPCLGRACDTLANVSLSGLDQMSDAAAHAVLLLSKRNFTKQPLA